MQPSPSQNLIQQLSRNSAPYHDPVARIRWGRLSTAEYWLPPEAISLHGVLAFMDLPEAQRRRLSQYEFLHFIQGGLWLEGIFMERIARSLQSARQSLTDLKYRLQELREESGHSLMFLELMERSGLAAPPLGRAGVRLAAVVGRHMPVESVVFWMAVVIGEEVPDRLNRYLRRHGEQVCPTIVDMCTLHIIDEARHISYGREVLEARLRALPAWQRPLLRPLMARLLRQFVRAFYYPPARIYELAGLSPGRDWAARARRSPARRAFVDHCINPTLQLLRKHGFRL